LAHHADSGHFHAHVVQSLGVLQPDTVLLGEGTADRDAENLSLDCARCTYGAEIVAIACRELRRNSGRWGAFDGGCLSAVGGDSLLRNDGVSGKCVGRISNEAAQEQPHYQPTYLFYRVFHVNEGPRAQHTAEYRTPLITGATLCLTKDGNTTTLPAVLMGA